MRRRPVHLLLTATGVLLLGASWVVGTPMIAGHASPAAAAGCGPAGRAGDSDVDSDGVTDPVVGLPGRSPTGGIVVHGSRTSDPPRFLAGSAFAGLNASRSFGTAIARHDVNGDGCDDLAVSDPDHAGGGAVDLLWGSPKGIKTTGAVQVLDPDAGGNDDFGAAVALYLDANTCRDCASGSALWVGAPGREVDGNADAGAVELFRVASDGTATHAGAVTEDDAHGSDGATGGNRFGSVLSGLYASGVDEGFYDGAVLVGVPNETVNGHLHAGAVMELADGYDPFGRGYSVGVGRIYTQGSDGVSGTPEVGDEFGASVSAADPFQAAIGAPGEDIATIHDAGLVQTFGIHDDCGDCDGLRPDGAITQNSPGVPGVAEAGDHFGASVAVGVQGGVSACTEFTWLPVREVVIGVPGEDNGGHADSGTVVQQTMSPVFTGDGEGDCAYSYHYRAFTQGPGTLLGGANEGGDEVGAAVDVTRAGECCPSSNPQPGLVMIGVPGESIGGLAEAGTVQTYDNRSGTVATVANVGGRRGGLRFGAVLPVEG